MSQILNWDELMGLDGATVSLVSLGKVDHNYRNGKRSAKKPQWKAQAIVDATRWIQVVGYDEHDSLFAWAKINRDKVSYHDPITATMKKEGKALRIESVFDEELTEYKLADCLAAKRTEHYGV